MDELTTGDQGRAAAAVVARDSYGRLLALLSACASKPQFTVDDGRKVDPVLRGSISTYGAGERAIRPAT